MRQQIAHISVHQTAKVLGVSYAVLSLLFIPLFMVANLATPEEAIPVALLALFPVIYGVLGYIFTALFCALYNLIAGWIGGIEITLRSAGAEGGHA